jgi:hypothetical protein
MTRSGLLRRFQSSDRGDCPHHARQPGIGGDGLAHLFGSFPIDDRASPPCMGSIRWFSGSSARCPPLIIFQIAASVAEGDGPDLGDPYRLTRGKRRDEDRRIKRRKSKRRRGAPRATMDRSATTR